MNYFITEAERNTTCYHEWSKGHFDGKSFWKSDSLLISEDTHYRLGLEGLFRSVIPAYSPIGETEVSKEQWSMIKKEADRLGNELLECVNEADIWAQKTFREYGVFTMIGM